MHLLNIFQMTLLLLYMINILIKPPLIHLISFIHLLLFVKFIYYLLHRNDEYRFVSPVSFIILLLYYFQLNFVIYKSHTLKHSAHHRMNPY